MEFGATMDYGSGCLKLWRSTWISKTMEIDLDAKKCRTIDLNYGDLPGN